MDLDELGDAALNTVAYVGEHYPDTDVVAIQITLVLQDKDDIVLYTYTHTTE